MWVCGSQKRWIRRIDEGTTKGRRWMVEPQRETSLEGSRMMDGGVFVVTKSPSRRSAIDPPRGLGLSYCMSPPPSHCITTVYTPIYLQHHSPRAASPYPDTVPLQSVFQPTKNIHHASAESD